MESIITPIILNYVQKYVNLRPKDAQISLWEGDIAFQNLDVRLDVLQGELQLPLEFLSGHIQELIIHIPWTRMTTEPIVITINTIEFVLQRKQILTTKVNIEASQEAVAQEDSSKSYINIFVEKVVNNVSITCNNIILKFVEEDIVVSMNIQLLSCFATNSDWVQSFVENMKTDLKRVVRISDLTVCLDKRNSAGQIEICQEPVLYKCSLESRLVFQYAATIPQKWMLTQFQTYTKSLELNISSLQFPMLLRLVLLLTCLKKDNDVNEPEMPNDTGSLQDEQDSASVLSWAWSKVPAIFPEEDAEQMIMCPDINFTIGLYVSNILVTLKSMDIIMEGIVNTSRKVRYTPMIRLNLKETYAEICSGAFGWLNVRAGVSQALVEELDCSDKLLSVGNGTLGTYLHGSLFAQQSIFSKEKKELPDIEEHQKTIDEKLLLTRTPALALDIVHYTDRSKLSQNAICKGNTNQDVLARLFISTLMLKLNTCTYKKVNVLQDMCNSYDYPPCDEKQSDTFDSSTTSNPKKYIKVMVADLIVEMHPLLDEQSLSNLNKNNIKLPYIVAEICCITGQWNNSVSEKRLFYPNVEESKKLQINSNMLYISDISIKNASICLHYNDRSAIVMDADNLALSLEFKANEHSFDDETRSMQVLWKIGVISVKSSRAEQITLLKLSKTLYKYSRKSVSDVLLSNAKKEMGDQKAARVCVKIYNASGSYEKYKTVAVVDGVVEMCQVFLSYAKVENSEVRTGSSLIFEAPNLNKHDFMTKSADSTHNFLKWKLQIPDNFQSQEFETVVYVAISNSILIMDPRLEAVLLYQDNVGVDKRILDVPSLGVDARASSSCAISDRNTRKNQQPDETVHISSEKDLKTEIVAKSASSFSQKNSEFHIVSNLLLKLEIYHCDIVLPGKQCDDIWYLVPSEHNHAPTDCFIMRLPFVRCKSYNSVDAALEKTFPVKPHVNVNSDVTKITWSCDFLDTSACFYHRGKYEFVLNPVTTIVTAVFEQKSNLIFAINFHLDTSSVICNICDNQIFFLKKTTCLMCLFFEVISKSGPAKPKSPALFEENVQIREFLTLDSNSDFSTEVISSQTADKTERNRNPPIWLQWTLTKITVNFSNLKHEPKSKIVFDFEDLTASVDQQNIYFKLKSKLGVFNVQCFSLNENGDWLINDDLKLAVQTQHPSNDRQSAFIDLTVTTAEIQNIFKKWGTKSQSERSTLSEIMLNLKAFEVHLSTKGVEHVLQLMKLLVNSDCQNTQLPKQDTTMIVTSVSDLPLLHFDCKGFIVYLPVEEMNTDHNVIILQVKQILIQPKVANPLSRKPLRPDLYSKAEQLRILQTPGSKIEDRQYELTVTNISLATTVWQNLQLAMEGYSDTYNKNPAVEWNNIDKKPVVTVNELFRDFTVSVIFAPSIMYGSVLVCGQSVEVNCLTDLHINASLDQAKLFKKAWQTMTKSIDACQSSEAPKSPNKPALGPNVLAMSYQSNEKQKHAYGKNESTRIKSKESKNAQTQFAYKNKSNDSGFASIERLTKTDCPIPYDISVVAGVFFVRFYDSKPDCSTLEHLPLLSIILKQPSMLITQTMNSHEVRYSVFDLVVKSEVCGNHEALFETKISNLNRAGVALPLISVVTKKTAIESVVTQCLIEQPLRFHVCENTLKVIFNVLAKVKSIFTEKENVISCKPLHKKPFIYAMRESLLIDADNCFISFHETHLEFVFGKGQGLKICINQMVSEANYSFQPDSLHLNLNIESIYVHTFHRFILHPLSVGCSVLIKQDQWLKMPVFICKLTADTLKIDIGPEQILDLIDMWQYAINRFQESLPTPLTEQTFKEKIALEIDIRSGTMLAPFKLPKPIKTASHLRAVEYFQDDLRAGAFQIIEDESSSNSSMPLPYQMKISSAFRTISWRYPEPRCLKKLMAYPIATEISGVENIACSLEYYNDARMSFVFCFEFQLSETEYQSFELPDTQAPAYIWRLVLKEKEANRFERKDDLLVHTENLKKDNKGMNLHALHLKLLIGSICIDSAYEPHKIPVMQIVSNISHLEINLKNQFQIENFRLPPALKDFSLANNIPANQTFLSMVVTNVCLFTIKTSENPYSVDFSFELTSRVLDYCYLNNLQFLEPTTVNGTLAVGNQSEVKIIVSSLHLNIGPAILHTISVSRDLWLQILDKDHKCIPIFTRFVICNRTNVTFCFGQTSSGESIPLNPGECSFYAFCTEHLEQQISFVFETENRHQICSLDVENEGVYYLNTGSYIVVVEVKNISSTQLCICVKGPLEIFSQSKESFEIQVPFHSTKRFNLIPYDHKSFVGDYMQETKHAIRLRLKGEKMWSGEIPLEPKKIPWLVKVPCISRQYISYWVEIIVEDVVCTKTCPVSFKRILVLIWPMFVLRSKLHCNVDITDIDGKVTYDLLGRGQETEVQVAGSNTSEHFFDFQNVSFPSNNGAKRVVLSYKGNNNVYKNKHSISGIEKYLAILKSPAVASWPSLKYDEMKFLESMPPSVDKELICTHRFILMRDYSPTLMLEIIPCCLFANETGNTVKILNITNYENVVVESNRIIALNFIQDAFKLYICRETHWIESKIIYAGENCPKNSESEEKTMQNETCIVRIQIHHDSTISDYVLSSHTENTILVYKLTPAFVIVNFTDSSLNFTPFSCEEGTVISESKLKGQMRFVRLAVKKTELSLRSTGLQIDDFFHIPSQTRFNGSLSPCRYISFLGQPNNEPSVPLMINKPFKRKCFNVLNESTSVPLIASVIEQNSQLIMTVFNDKSPAFKIVNQTNLTLYVASPKSIGEKLKLSTSDLNECSFGWYQKLYPNATIFYTPPEMYKGFPDAEVEHSGISLALAEAVNQDDIQWSKPYDMEVSNETLLHVPLYGDVKISACNEHKVSTIFICQITQGIEFSVKELRTRLTCRGKSNSAIYADEVQKCLSRTNLNSYEPRRNDEISCNACSGSPLKNGARFVTMFFKEIRIDLFFDIKKESYRKQDILSIYMDDAAFRYEEQNSMLSVIISNLQMDNRLSSSGLYDFPVIFCAEEAYLQRPTLPSIPILDEYVHSLTLNSFAECKIFFYKDEYHVKDIFCKISPTRTYVEDKYMNDLLEYLAACEFSNRASSHEEQLMETHAVNGYVIVPITVVNEGIYFSGTLCLRTLKIEPIRLILSVHTSARLYIALDHSSLCFSAYEKHNIYTHPSKLGHSIGLHYLSGALFGAGWVVGSLEILGSPGGLARSVSTGLKDFVSLPVQGLLRGPWGFVSGVTEGSVSLLRNVTAGTVNSVSKLAGSVARNLDRLTLDDDHFQRTEAIRRSQPQSLTAGFSRGLAGLGINLLGAIGGLARHPLEAKTSIQVALGVAKGIVGAITKPLSGAAELLALTGQGVLHTVGFNLMPQQRLSTYESRAIFPAEDKLLWKHGPTYSFISTSQLLFYHEAALVASEHLQQVFIALTPLALIILEHAHRSAIEVIPTDRLEITVDDSNRNCLKIQVLPCRPLQEETDETYFNFRMISYLRDSSDNLELPLDGPQSQTNLSKTKLKLYMDELSGKNLARYVKLLQNDKNFLSNFTCH